METKVESALPQEPEKESRREFLKTAGKVALYAPPAFMLLMQPSREALACKSLNGSYVPSQKFKPISRYKSRSRFRRYKGDRR